MEIAISHCKKMLDSLDGPAIQVIVTSSTGNEKSWVLPVALLVHNSGYFKRLRNFKEGDQGKVTLEDFEPDIFKLFVEFIYLGQYTHCDNPGNSSHVHDSAKAWVLGDYLDAVNFKNLAMKHLHSVYFPLNKQAPKSLVRPQMIEYCCASAPAGSKMYKFILHVLVVYWHDLHIVFYKDENRPQWEEIWDAYPQIRNDILFYTSQSETARKHYRKDLAEYLESSTSNDELRAESEKTKP